MSSVNTSKVGQAIVGGERLHDIAHIIVIYKFQSFQLFRPESAWARKSSSLSIELSERTSYLELFTIFQWFPRGIKHA